MGRRISQKRKDAAAATRKVDSTSGPVAVQECDTKIGDYPGGRGDRIVISDRITNNHRYIDIRRWYRVKDTTEFDSEKKPVAGAYRPTGKGLSVGFKPEVLRAVAQALIRGAEIAEAVAATKETEGGEDGE